MQDRANYYRFKKRDKTDSKDCLFKTKEARKMVKKLFNKGKISTKTKNIIVNNTPFVKVDIYDDYLKVKVLNKGKKINQDICYSYNPSKFIGERINPKSLKKSFKKANVNELIVCSNKDYRKNLRVYLTLDNVKFYKDFSYLDESDEVQKKHKKYLFYVGGCDTGSIEFNPKDKTIKMRSFSIGDEEIEIVASVKSKKPKSIISGKRVKFPNIKDNYLCIVKIDNYYTCGAFIDKCEKYHKSFKTFGKGYKGTKEWDRAFNKCNLQLEKLNKL